MIDNGTKRRIEYKNIHGGKMDIAKTFDFIKENRDKDAVFSDGDRLVEQVLFADYPGNLRLFFTPSSGRSSVASFPPRAQMW